MKNRLCVAVAVGLFLSTFLLSGFTPALAQSSEGFEIKPAIIEERVDPGRTYDFSLSIKNLAPTQKTLYLLSQDITGLNDQGLPIFASEGDEPTPYELTSWITLSQESITLGAGETGRVSFSIAVPANASPGAHFAGVFFDSQPEQRRTTGAGIGVRVGSIINLRIAGEANESARIREFSTDNIIYNAPPVSFTTRMENLGNVLLRPQGIIEVTDMLGKQVASISVNESAAPTFPESEKNYTAVWEHDGFAFGRYEAMVSLVYGDDVRKTVTAVTSFWVLPAKPIFITLGTLVGIIFVMSLVTKLYIRKKLREMGISRSTGVNAQRQARKYQRSATRMMTIVIAVFMLVSAFVVMLFLMFA